MANKFVSNLCKPRYHFKLALPQRADDDGIVPCSAFALGLAALKLTFFFIDSSAIAGNGFMLQCHCIAFFVIELHEF